MIHASPAAYLRTARSRPGPIALIACEDDVALSRTVTHHLEIGFATVVLLLHSPLPAPATLPERVDLVRHDLTDPDALVQAANVLMPGFAGRWIYLGYNAEFLHFPFMETRRIAELLTFHMSERRKSMIGLVVDLYPRKPTEPAAVAEGPALIDTLGYHATPRKDPAANWAEVERQRDCFGGLRWRYEEHVPWERRRIDRVALVEAQPSLRFAPDFTLNEAELNTYRGAWHNAASVAVCSYRAAKSLCRNPGAKAAISRLDCPSSAPFEGGSQQLMSLGLMEPGQWF